MVCVIDLIKSLKDKLLSHINIDLALYNYINNIDVIPVPFEKNSVMGIAFRGYKKEKDESFNLRTIDSQQKQNNFKDKFAQCIGVRLFTSASQDTVLEDFQRFDLKQKYIMTKIFPFLKHEFKRVLLLENNSISNFLNLLVNYDESCDRREIEYNYLLDDNSDIIDLIILEDYVKMYCLTRNNIHDYKEFVIEILNNFSNSIKHITLLRYKGRQIYEIDDEYDVQDILCTILQSVFPDCEKEDPMGKDNQGLSHRIDLVIHSLGIYIEVKMIKQDDKSNIRNFKKQINEDIVGYSVNKDLKHLIFFTYDPYKFADNEKYFYEKEQTVTNNNQTYTVDKVYQK